MPINVSKPIHSLSQFIEHVEEHCGGDDVLFRGQSTDLPLLPKIARIAARPNVATAELAMLADFRRQAVPYLDVTPENDWDWLALAQHWGMATRLLDWTSNALAALWFAVERPALDGKPGVVWHFNAKNTDFLSGDPSPSPFAIAETVVFRPRHVTHRIIAQSGWFTAHKYVDSSAKKYMPLDSNKKFNQRLTKLEISSTAFPEIRYQLDRCGVNASALFGGIDGLCRHVQWFHSLLSDEA